MKTIIFCHSPRRMNAEWHVRAAFDDQRVDAARVEIGEERVEIDVLGDVNRRAAVGEDGVRRRDNAVAVEDDARPRGGDASPRRRVRSGCRRRSCRRRRGWRRTPRAAPGFSGAPASEVIQWLSRVTVASLPSSVMPALRSTNGRLVRDGVDERSLSLRASDSRMPVMTSMPASREFLDAAGRDDVVRIAHGDDDARDARRR